MLLVLGMLLAAVLQTTVLETAPASWPHPDVVAVLVFAWASLKGRLSGLRAALVGGLAIDVLGSQPLGLTVVTLLAGAYLAGWLREQLAEPVLAVSVLAVICGSFFADLVQAAYLAGSGGFLSWRALLLRAVLPAAASNGLVSVALLPVLHGFAEGGEREPGGFLRRTLPGRLWR